MEGSLLNDMTEQKKQKKNKKRTTLHFGSITKTGSIPHNEVLFLLSYHPREWIVQENLAPWNRIPSSQITIFLVVL